MNSEISFKQRIQGESFSKSVTIKFPLKLYDRFDKYAKDYANHCYWLAIEKLITEIEVDKEYDKQLRALAMRIHTIESYLAENMAKEEEDNKDVHMTFGGKENGK